MRQDDDAGLHSSHGEAGHGAVRLSGQGAEVSIYHGNDIFHQVVFHGADIELHFVRFRSRNLNSRPSFGFELTG